MDAVWTSQITHMHSKHFIDCPLDNYNNSVIWTSCTFSRTRAIEAIQNLFLQFIIALR